MTVWLRTEVSDNQDAKREVMAFNAEQVFSTPKPERLLQRVLELSTRRLRKKSRKVSAEKAG